MIYIISWYILAFAVHHPYKTFTYMLYSSICISECVRLRNRLFSDLERLPKAAALSSQVLSFDCYL